MKGDAYVPGALTTGFSIEKVQSSNALIDTICMITSDVSEEARMRLELVFDHVIRVPYLQYSCRGLKTQKQQDMYEQWVEVSFTKWNCLLFTQYEKVCFVDADKIFLVNCDEIFELHAPAGTFSSPWSEPFIARSKNPRQTGKGLRNPYKHLDHGDIVPESCIREGLASSFVAIGTMLLLAPSLSDYNDFKDYVASANPFGYSSFSMMDEQSISSFYLHKKKPWTFIHQRYNYIPWQRHWLDSLDAPKVFHYFGKKVWSLPRDNRWPDVEVWWQLVSSLLASRSKEDATFLLGAFDPLLISLSFQLEKQVTPLLSGCCWCQTCGLEEISWKNHNFLNEAADVDCPLLKGSVPFQQKFHPKPEDIAHKGKSVNKERLESNQIPARNSRARSSRSRSPRESKNSYRLYSPRRRRRSYSN